MLDALVFDALADFRQVMALAQIDAPLDNVRRQILLKPHKAKALPLGQMAVYSFFRANAAISSGFVSNSIAVL